MLADRTHHCRLLGMALCLLVAVPGASAVAAEIYRWHDADGNLNFGSNPPPDVDAEPVELDARSQPTDTPTETAADEAAVTDEEVEPDAEADSPTDTTPEPEPLSDERCEQLELDYTMLESRPSGILVPDDDGSVRRMSPDEQEERMANIREQLNTRCD